ncbi:MAG: hypothetical protein IJ335_10830 [Lachnospiraceae bacterium]|nr:hypothetical protein [Lachnospiraceae bacterium]
MSSVVDKLRKHPNFIKALLLSLLPLLACVILCGIDGKMIWDVYLPLSEWNDEIFYYKQVEAMVEYGIPQGYFGFDESRAPYASFGAWNPLVLIPYVLWGWIFGWNLLSPILCNIVLLMAAVFGYVLLVRPDKRQCFALVVLYMASMFTTRYCLSVMAEAILMFYGILFLGFCISNRREAKKYKLFWAIFMVVQLALIRPYLLTLILWPAYEIYKKSKWKACGIVVITGIGSIGLYFAIVGTICAPYFRSLINTDWIKTFFWAGPWEGIKFTIKQILDAGLEYLGMCLDGIRGVTERHGLALQFLVILVVLCVQTIIELVKKKKDLYQHLLLTISFGGSLLALLLLYQLHAGGRHLMLFVTMGVFIISHMEGKRMGKVVVTAVLLAFAFIQMPDRTLYERVPYETETAHEEYMQLKTALEEGMELKTEEVPSFDNAIIWTISDMVEGESRETYWQHLYAVPAGFGINCCSDGYVKHNFETLQCRYIMIPCDGDLEEMCKAAGKAEVARTEKTVIYDLK